MIKNKFIPEIFHLVVSVFETFVGSPNFCAMGNVTKTQRAAAEQERKEAELKAAKICHKTKRAILSVVDLGGVWKEEWKVALQELVVDRIVVKVVDSNFVLGFRGVPGLLLNLTCYCISQWSFPNTDVSSNSNSNSDENSRLRLSLTCDSKIGYTCSLRHDAVCNCHNLTTDIVQVFDHLDILNKLQAKLPYNLCRQVFRAFYICGGYESGTHPDHQESVQNESRWGGGVLEKLLQESQVYVLPQHYAADIFRGIPCDRNWIRLTDIPGNRYNQLQKSEQNFPVQGTQAWCRSDEMQIRVHKYLATIQCRNLIELLFRHDKRKCDFAKQLLDTIDVSAKVINTTGYVSAKVISVTMETINLIMIQQSLQQLQSQDLVPVPFLNCYYTAKDQLVENSAHAKELFLISQFDSRELAQLIECIVKTNIEYLFGNSLFRSNFPSPNDHFDNLKKLRGRVTETPVHKEMESFRHFLFAAEQQLENDIKFPAVLARLTTEYLSFPAPNILQRCKRFCDDGWIIPSDLESWIVSTW